MCGVSRLALELDWPVAASIHTWPVLVAGDEMGCGLTDAQSKGGYPPDLRLDACPVEWVFDDGQEMELEGFRLRAIRVRGHSADSFAYLFAHDGKRCLISGDIVFYGGVVGMINTPDSSLQSYREDMPKLAGLGVDALLPGHGLFTLSGGQRHIDVAQQELDKGFVPRCIGQGDLIF
jgi:glyoxylase-like metal-dependent hydrolase (beta-lactamase superfamily II)